MKLTLERAQELNQDMVTQENLIIHSKNVMAAMEAMARYFGEDTEHWKAIGYLHDLELSFGILEKHRHAQKTHPQLRETINNMNHSEIRGSKKSQSLSNKTLLIIAA